MIIVTLPDGNTVEFPKGTSKDVINNAIIKNFPQFAPKKQAVSPVEKEDPRQKMMQEILDIDPEEEARKLSETLKIAASFLAPAMPLGAAGTAISKIPAVGKYLSTALSQGLPQAGLAAAGSFAEGENPLKAGATAGGISGLFSALSQAAAEGSPVTRALARGLTGVGLGGLGYAGGKAAGLSDLPAAGTGLALGLLGAKKGVSPKTKAARRVLEGVEGPETQKTLEAAERLGLKYITPAEASGSPFVGATQGTIGKTAKGARELYQRGQERIGTEKESIQKLFKTIYDPKELDPMKKELYEQAEKGFVSADTLSKLKENQIFKAALKKAKKDPIYKEIIKDKPALSVGRLDKVKRIMDDMHSKASKEKTLTKARAIDEARSSLIEKLDEAAPTYEAARQLAEREITLRNFKKQFKDQDIIGSVFGKKLQDDLKYNDLLKSLRNAPEAQQMLKDMKLVFPKLINIPTGKTAAAQAGMSMSKDRASSQYLKRLLDEVFSGGKLDVESVKLMTDPNWIQKSMRDPSMMERRLRDAFMLMARPGSQILTKQVNDGTR